jgi:Domain of unknown function (DUF1707)
MATGSNIRVGDAERDAVATQLREHYATGRLTLDELNERLDQTFRARTGADLKAVMRDLPPAGNSGATAPGGPGGAQDRPWGGHGSWDGGFGGRRHGLSAVGALIPVVLGLWALLALAGLFAFGFAGGRPLAIVFILAALAMIRRLFGGRRRYGRPFGAPYGRRCGRRW